MLGEMIGEEQGKITGIRVLPSEGQNPRMEVSFQASGRLVGVETTTMGTYISTLMPNGVFNGVGQGVVQVVAEHLPRDLGHVRPSRRRQPPSVYRPRRAPTNRSLKAA